MSLPQEKAYTIEDISALPDGERAELVNGDIFYMAPPSTMHQRISRKLTQIIANYIDSKNGSCEVFAAPFGVFPDDDAFNYLEPDLSVICDPGKLKEDGCHGAPDWVIEILSPSSKWMDSYTKLVKYRTAGVREYWIIDDQKKRITVWNFEQNTTEEYSFHDSVKAGIYEDLTIDFSQLKF